MTIDLTVTDMYCGAGGSTTGAVLAGADVKLAINHWKRAIQTHNTNYPQTAHVLTDLHQANPRRFPSTTILLASPECTAHSLAKGRKRTHQHQLALWEQGEPDLGAEAEERSRCSMWTPLEWSEFHAYQAVILENVVDVHLWRPFQSWLQAWKSLDYDFEIVYLNSMHAHPTPQSRDRMYFVAWKRKNSRPNLTITPRAHCETCNREVESVQSWKNPRRRYGKYRQQYVYCCPGCASVVIPSYYAAASAIDWSIPAPSIGERSKPLREKTLRRLEDGLRKFAAHPFLLDHLGEYRLRSLSGPISTICASGNHHSLVVPPSYSWLMTYYNRGQLVPVSEAVPTVTTLDRHALVTSESKGSAALSLSAQDCRFRMLVPKEIQAAMAFPDTYIVTGTRREQIKQLGNAVTPPVMKLLMERVIASLS